MFAVVDDVTCVSPNESSTVGASTIDYSRAACFGRVLRKCGSALRRREVARVLEKTFVNTEVEKVLAIGWAITIITVSTVDCVVDGTAGAAGGCETDVAVETAVDVDEKASVMTEAAAAILGGAIALETAVKAELVTAVDVGVIVKLNAGCANRLETGSVVLERLKFDEVWAAVGKTNEKAGPLENDAPNKAKAEPGVDKCGERIGM